MTKKSVILIFLFICLNLVAQNNYLDGNITLREFCEKKYLPVRKVLEYLELPQDTDIDKTVSELGCSATDLSDTVDKYYKNQQAYSWGIVIVGMGTVFVSLVLVALIIGQLRHLDKKKRKKAPVIPAYSTAGLDTSEEDEIVSAIVTSIFLYELEVEENNRLMLTWKRAPISMWKAARLVPMNEIDPSRRK